MAGRCCRVLEGLIVVAVGGMIVVLLLSAPQVAWNTGAQERLSEALRTIDQSGLVRGSFVALAMTVAVPWLLGTGVGAGIEHCLRARHGEGFDCGR